MKTTALRPPVPPNEEEPGRSRSTLWCCSIYSGKNGIHVIERQVIGVDMSSGNLPNNPPFSGEK